MQAQRIEVGMVADPRQHRHHHLQDLGGFAGLAHIDGIFGLQVQIHQVRQHAQYRLAGALLQPVQPRLQQRDIAAKTVDDEALHARLLAFREQRQGPDQVCEHATLVDISDQDHRAVHRLGEAHVGDITGAQIDLRRRACALDHHHAIRSGQPPVRVEHGLQRDAFVVVVGSGIHAGHRAAMDDHLGPDVAVGLQEHRVHVGVRRKVGGLRLYRLGTADFAAVGGHRAVERHVLRLERRHRDTLARQPAAQRGHQRALASVGRGALHHQRGHGCCSR